MPTAPRAVHSDDAAPQSPSARRTLRSSFRTPSPTASTVYGSGQAITRQRDGCLTCRIRRKKCSDLWDPRDSLPTRECSTCSRLGIECLGWSRKRPSWMKARGKDIPTEMCADIKPFLALAGRDRHGKTLKFNQYYDGYDDYEPPFPNPPPYSIFSQDNMSSSATPPPTVAPEPIHPAPLPSSFAECSPDHKPQPEPSLYDVLSNDPQTVPYDFLGQYGMDFLAYHSFPAFTDISSQSTTAVPHFLPGDEEWFQFSGVGYETLYSTNLYYPQQ